MRLITKQETFDWCRERGVGLRFESSQSSRLRFDAGKRAIRVWIAGSAVDVLNLAYVLLMTGAPEDDEKNFGGALVWLRDWDIWSTGIEQVGHVLLTGVRGTAPPSVAEAPSHVFGPSEFAEANAALALPMLFQWDALLAPVHGQFIANVSHHGYFDLFVPDVESESALVARFKVGGYQLEQLGEVHTE